MDYYELMGYDYVLDLLSEMEIPPGFPYCKSYYLVSSDRTQEPQTLRRGIYSNSLVIHFVCLNACYMC